MCELLLGLSKYFLEYNVDRATELWYMKRPMRFIKLLAAAMPLLCTSTEPRRNYQLRFAKAELHSEKTLGTEFKNLGSYD